MTFRPEGDLNRYLCGHVFVDETKTKDQHADRAARLTAVVEAVLKDQVTHLVIERDESLARSDLELISHLLYPVTDKPT